MQFFKKNSINLILCLGELIVGILLLVNPDAFTQAIVMVLGAVLAVMGVLSVFRYFRTEPVLAAAEKSLAFGLGQLLLGVFFLWQSGWLMKLFTVLNRLYGTAALVLALCRIQQFVDVRRLKLGKGIVTGVSALITLVYAFLILLIPEITWGFIGVALLVEALMDILILCFERRV